MGLLQSMFGGGTDISLELDVAEVPEGGILSGRATLKGGKKPLTLTTLKVQLLYVSVTTNDDSPLPDIDIQILLDETVAEGEELAPESSQSYDFSFTIPMGTEPTAHNVSYKVKVAADIPKVKDPTAEADLKVVAAQDTGFLGFDKGARAISAQELFVKYPGLQSADEEELCDAINEVMLDAYDEDNNLTAAEPLLVKHIKTGTLRVRTVALECWGNVLNNRARKDNLKILDELAHDPTTPADLRDEVVKVAAKFAEEGAMHLCEEFAGHADEEVREAIATALYFDGDSDVRGRKKLLLKMIDDGAEAVRASVFRSLSMYTDDEKVMKLCAERAGSDASPEVQKACISSLQLAHHHGMADLVFDTYLKHLGNPNQIVRKELTESLHWLPEDARLGQLVQSLLADTDEEVRRSMAWQFRNLSQHPELGPLCRHAAENDASEEVRGDALGGLGSVMPVPELVPYLRGRMGQEAASETILWGIFEGIRDHSDEPDAQPLLQELAACSVESVASSAQDLLQ